MITTLRFSLVTVLLVAACGGATPSPSASPTGSPTPSGSPSPSGSPTPTQSLTSSPSPTFTGDAISHPTGPTDLVLQADSVGGFVPVDFIVTNVPYFSLYGDGTVIIRPTEERGRVMAPGQLPRLLVAKLTEEQVQALLRFALGQGRLLDARAHYPQNSCADCPATVFRLNAAGVEKTVTVDALGIEEGIDQVDRRGFVALANTLMTFEQRALAGEMGEVSLYDPTHYLVALFEAQPGQGEAVEWPWREVSADDFTSPDDAEWRREAVLSREQVEAITEVPSGGAMSIFVEDVEGNLWSVALRPLLPNEGEE